MKKSNPKQAKVEAGALTVVPDDQSALMGDQLSVQYDKATNAMAEVVIFGAMMLKLYEIHPHWSARGPTPKGCLGVKEWLGKFAPKVKPPTAFRFLAVTESIAKGYEQIVGKGFAKKFTLTALVTTPAAKLPKDAAAKQLSFFDYIAGTSQRSWLDQFRETERPGYKRRHEETNEVVAGKGKRKTAAELAQEAKEELESILNALNGFFLAKHHTRTPKDRRATAAAVLEEAKAKLEAVAD